MAGIKQGMEGGVVLSVIQKVATKRGVEPTELPPLSETIDPDALTTLLEDSIENDLCIEFEYCGHVLTITSIGDVTVDKE